MNKVAAVDASLRNLEPSDPQVALNKSVPTEKVQSEVEVYIPCCLTACDNHRSKLALQDVGYYMQQGQDVADLRRLLSTGGLAEGPVTHGLCG